MKRLVYIFIFLLSLLLMCILSSCRSPKTVTKLSTSTDSVKISQKDSTSKRFSFTFDSLLFSTTDDSGFQRMQDTFCSSPDDSCLIRSYPQISVVNKKIPRSRLIVYGGKVQLNNTSTSQSDSTRRISKSDVESVKIRSRPSIPILLIIDIVVILAIIILAIRLYRNRLSS